VPLICQLPGAKLLLVGGTDEEIAPLAQQAAALNVQDRIVFELARPQAEMPAFMAAADVLVSPRIRGINPPGSCCHLASDDRRRDEYPGAQLVARWQLRIPDVPDAQVSQG
jgi:hypothetical protein